MSSGVTPSPASSGLTWYSKKDTDPRGTGTLCDCPGEDAYVADICDTIPFHCEASLYGMCLLRDDVLKPVRCGQAYGECTVARNDPVDNPLKQAFRNTLGKKKFVWRNRAWHAECFTCIWCNKPIGLSSFVPVGMRGIHIACFEVRKDSLAAADHSSMRDTIRDMRAKLLCNKETIIERMLKGSVQTDPCINNATEPRPENYLKRLDIHSADICDDRRDNTGIQVTKCPDSSPTAGEEGINTEDGQLIESPELTPYPTKPLIMGAYMFPTRDEVEFLKSYAAAMEAEKAAYELSRQDRTPLKKYWEISSNNPSSAGASENSKDAEVQRQTPATTGPYMVNGNQVKMLQLLPGPNGNVLAQPPAAPPKQLKKAEEIA